MDKILHPLSPVELEKLIQDAGLCLDFEFKSVQKILENKLEDLSDFTVPLNSALKDFLKKLEIENDRFKYFRGLSMSGKKALLIISKELAIIVKPAYTLSDLLSRILKCKDETDLDFLLNSFEKSK